MSDDLERLEQQVWQEVLHDVTTDPSLLRKAASFISAEATWLLHGRPYRDVMDINHIYYKVCTPCEFFENDGCRICGCRIVPNERSPLNKVSMATTNCPLPNNPKWISTVTPPNMLTPEAAGSALQNSKAVLVEQTLPAYDPILSDTTLQTLGMLKKKEADAAVANPFTRTQTGQLVQGDES